ncbi:MAG TPA: hypothetical protein VE754_04325 [Actinomycetota bacterium]|nr:hypothetical protein [Actinomycetota bacterium]
MAIAAVGEGGHQVFLRWGDELGHHAFHILFGVGAFVVFGIYALVDVLRHGPPRIRPPSEPPGED